MSEKIQFVFIDFGEMIFYEILVDLFWAFLFLFDMLCLMYIYIYVYILFCFEPFFHPFSVGRHLM